MATKAVAAYETRFASIEIKIEQLSGRVGQLTAAVSLLGVATIGILISQFALWNVMGKLEGQFSSIGTQVSHIEQMVTDKR